MSSPEQNPLPLHIPQPEDILTENQVNLLIEAQEGHLPCPQCEEPLIAWRQISDDYNDVVLSCGHCGFRER